jgi:hypothetical protein
MPESISVGKIMIRNFLFAATLGLAGVGCGNLSQILDAGAQVSQATGYSPAQLSQGVKDTLALSVTRASDQLSQTGGYANGIYRIELPGEMQAVSDILVKFDLGNQVVKIEALMNQGAEIAAAEAKTVFLQTVSQMSINDALGIIRGGNTAATDYFKAQTGPVLQQRYQDIMRSQLNQLGFYGQYQKLLSAYNLLPVANKPNLDLEQLAVTQGIDGLFAQIAQEEIKIRANPLEQSSLLIAGIFK